MLIPDVVESKREVSTVSEEEPLTCGEKVTRPFNDVSGRHLVWSIEDSVSLRQ